MFVYNLLHRDATELTPDHMSDKTQSALLELRLDLALALHQAASEQLERILQALPGHWVRLYRLL